MKERDRKNFESLHITHGVASRFQINILSLQHFGLEENTFEGWFSLEETGHCENLWCGFDFNHCFGGLNYPL